MTIYKRKNKYYCRFQINGERHNFLCNGATNKKEAEQIENAFKYKLQQQQNGVIPPNIKRVTFKQLMQIHLDYAKLNKKSWETDKSRIKYFIEFFGGNTIITKIKPEKIEQFKEWLLKGGRSKTTANRYLEQLSKAFNLALNNGYILKNPMQNVNKFPLKNYSIRYLKEDEEKRLYEVMPEYLKGIVTVALNTGLRKSNILNLQWSQINLEFRHIEILENKGNKHIIIPINDVLYKFFMEHLSDNEYVFTNPETNEPYTDIKKVWKTALEKAKIENFRFHDLRHTVGTRLAKNNVPINVIKEILAHSDIKTTMRYIHCTENEKLNALNILGCVSN